MCLKKLFYFYKIILHHSIHIIIIIIRYYRIFYSFGFSYNKFFLFDSYRLWPRYWCCQSRCQYLKSILTPKHVTENWSSLSVKWVLKPQRGKSPVNRKIKLISQTTNQGNVCEVWVARLDIKDHALKRACVCVCFLRKRSHGDCRWQIVRLQGKSKRVCYLRRTYPNTATTRRRLGDTCKCMGS